jgi:hypothetical protein
VRSSQTGLWLFVKEAAMSVDRFDSCRSRLVLLTVLVFIVCYGGDASSQTSTAPKTVNRPQVIAPTVENDYHARRTKADEMSEISTVPISAEISDRVGLTTLSPAPLLKFDSHSLGHDPSVAAGHTYLLVVRSHKYSFYDKQGNLLPMKNGMKSQWGSTEFFAPLLSDKNPDSTTNQNSINRHLGLPAQYATACDPANPSAANSACVTEFYDSRVLYDFERRRFFIIAAARNQIWRCKGTEPPGTDCARADALKRRYIAVAVSKTEDPRDGFRYYILVNQYADWPQCAIQGKYLVLNHRSNMISWPEPLNVFVFAIDPLVNGTAPAIGSVPLRTFSKADFPGSYRIFPVTHRTISNAVTLLVAQDTANSITVFGLQSMPGTQPPVLVKAEPLQLSHEGVIPAPNPVFRAGDLHLASSVCVDKQGDTCNRYSIRLMRIPVAIGADKVPKPSKGGHFLDLIFGKNAVSDASGDLVSYMYPALDVTKHGDIVVAYMRKGVKTMKPLYAEVRYSIFYRDAKAIRRSRLLAAGDYDAGNPQDAGIDHGGAYLDPANEEIVWMSNARADKTINGWRQEVGAVKP